MSEWCCRCGSKYQACEKCTNEMIRRRDEEIARLRRALGQIVDMAAGETCCASVVAKAALESVGS